MVESEGFKPSRLKAPEAATGIKLTPANYESLIVSAVGDSLFS
jgi:hypothetical protein